MSETKYRQDELNKKIEKFHQGFYHSYYYQDNVIVFVKYFKTTERKHCCNIEGLVVDI
jgi:hypothetical protein